MLNKAIVKALLDWCKLLGIEDVWHQESNIEIVVRDLWGEILTVAEGHNYVTDSGHNLIRDALRGQVTSGINITYIALGSSNASAGDTTLTQLVSEQYRQQISSQSAGTVGVANIVSYISPTVANSFTTNEIGWFAGAASGTANSGILVARYTGFSRSKVATESWQVTRTDTFN